MLADVERIIREVATTEILPWWQALDAEQISEKGPGDIVTEVDRRAETVLTELLRGIRNVPVVGEEATAADPRLPELLRTEPSVWLVDPIDGTSNFVAGRPDFAVMVALVEAGETVASWIWQPIHELMAVAARGEGARVNGQTIVVPADERPPTDLAGVVKRRYLPPPLREVVDHTVLRFGSVSAGRGCAGVDYPNLVRRKRDFLFYWSTLPWDHAPGALLAQEAGCRVSRLDGMPYQPGEDEDGLLISHPRSWPDIQQALIVR